VRHFAVSAVGRDRPGIVAAVTEVLLERGLNVEDSQMTILCGHFTMMLVVSAPDDLDEGALRADLDRAGDRLGLESMSLADVEEIGPAAQPSPSHVVTVYGTDHPGIVHAVATALGEREVNITDLNTRLVGEEGEEPLYAMMMEVELPAGVPAAELEEALAGVGREQGVEVSVRPLEQDVL
jgi:glycine cleavage system transcriptional repressor